MPLPNEQTILLLKAQRALWIARSNMNFILGQQRELRDALQRAESEYRALVGKIEAEHGAKLNEETLELISDAPGHEKIEPQRTRGDTEEKTDGRA